MAHMKPVTTEAEAIAVAARAWAGLERIAHGFGALLAAPVLALCLHLELVTGDGLYVGFIGVAVLAVYALLVSTPWAVATGAAVAAAALAVAPVSAVALGDKACVLATATAVGVAIHIARGRTRRRMFALQRAERRAAGARLEATARLAGGLAHDFNNLLCVIATNAELLAEPGLAPEVQAAMRDEIADAAARGTAITRQLVAFGRQQLVAPMAVAPADELRRAERILRRAVGAAVTLTVDAPATASISVDPGQLVHGQGVGCVGRQRQPVGDERRRVGQHKQVARDQRRHAPAAGFAPDGGQRAQALRCKHEPHQQRQRVDVQRVQRQDAVGQARAAEQAPGVECQRQREGHHHPGQHVGQDHSKISFSGAS